MVTDAVGLSNPATRAAEYVSGQFGSGYMPYEYDGTFGTLPHLTDMTTAALDILDNNPDGFFLMVEGGRIDHAGHDNDLERNVEETLEFADSVQIILTWAAGRDDTLVIVTADHETGGMTVLTDNPGDYPTVSWTTGGHTGANVPVYAWGGQCRPNQRNDGKHLPVCCRFRSGTRQHEPACPGHPGLAPPRHDPFRGEIRSGTRERS